MQRISGLGAVGGGRGGRAPPPPPTGGEKGEQSRNKDDLFMVHMCVRLKGRAVWWPGWAGGGGDVGWGEGHAQRQEGNKNLTQNQKGKEL